MNGCVRICCFAALLAGVRVSGADATMTSLRAAHDVTPDTDPNSEFWRDAPHVIAERDSAGKPVPRYATEVRSRWTSGNLYFLFICPYNELWLKPNPSTTTETNELWNWDVAEVFLGSDFKDIRHYREFEISPQGEWIDLDVDLHKPHHEDGWVWNSGFQVAARIDRAAKIWYGAMRIPFSAIAIAQAAPGMQFRMNLFRGEGPPGNWRSVTWQPPLAETFHTPERFGLLELVAGPDVAALSAVRDAWLDDLIHPHNYAPGKNSFLVQGLKKGQRKTVLDLDGAGSVRHIWSTWSVPAGDTAAPPGAVRMLVFVDGGVAIDGPVDQVCGAAGTTGTRDVPMPAFIYEGAYNLYKPIAFTHGVRIEIEALRDLEEFYTQIDYRRGAQDRARAAASPLRSGTVRGAELALNGPGILRRLTFRGSSLSNARLKIYWDGDKTASVDAPLQYFFADFVNAAIESGPDRMTCYFPMPFRRAARIVLETPPEAPKPDAIEYAVEHTAVPANAPYFHAQFQESAGTTGYGQFPVLRVQGNGLFVGVNLFDTGHNHGGGDAALIDAGTAEPRVLHGICGEDYFSFAWHRTGVMTPLTGAPVHARRYRLHLENPYPFHESLQFLFGVFAGLQPKSVAFWYQAPGPAVTGEWSAVDVPWKALGPLGAGTPSAATVNAAAYDTRVAFKDVVPLHEQWQDADMVHGFADLTYLFRHYVFTSSGTGYVAGAGRTELTTSVFSAADQIVNALLGHDDALAVTVNGTAVAPLPAQSGFGASTARLPLHRGWNSLRVVVSNDENTDWRWCGLSLAINSAAARGLRFSASPSEVSGRRAEHARTHG